jgi:hypothetical protein
MPVLTDWSIEISLEDVFAIQRADGARILARSPKLYRLTQEAVAAAPAFLFPQVAFTQLPISEIVNGQVLLEGGAYRLSSITLAEQFVCGEIVTAAVCTIGGELEKEASRAMGQNQHAYAYALDSAGTIALDRIVDSFYESHSNHAQVEGRTVSHRFSPGLEDWPVSKGQPEIFKMLQNETLTVELAPSYQMRPLKSVSFVFAAGRNMTRSGSSCDYCSNREYCLHRAHQEGKNCKNVAAKIAS